MGRGNPRAHIVIVGEAPGTEEDAAGRPFIGDAGKVLSDLLARAELPEAEVYITNAVACWPAPTPGSRSKNGKPPGACVAACHDLHLTQHLAAIGPRVVVALGAYATASLDRVSPAMITMGPVLSVPTSSLAPFAVEVQPHTLLDPEREYSPNDDVPGGVPVLVGYHPAYLARLNYWGDRNSVAALSTLAMLFEAKRLANGVKRRVGLPIAPEGA